MLSRRSLLLLASVWSLLLSSALLQAQRDNLPKSCTPQEKDPKRHQQFLKDKETQLQKGPIKLVFLGDSITDGWRGGNGKPIFEQYYGKYNALNLGIGGDRTEHVLWRIDHGELDGLMPKVVVLMIGTNNLGTHQSVQDTIEGIKCDVNAIHQKLPEAKILLLAVFPRVAKPDQDYPAEIKQVNEAISKLDGKDNVKYLDIGSKFLNSEGALPRDVMPDGLHPNANGYKIWAEAMQPTLEELMK